MSHKHDFLDCGYDEQQCDSACRAESHLCSTCGKSRSELAKDVRDVRQHVIDSTKEIAKQLGKVENLRTLEDIVGTITHYSKELEWLSREQLVEMAVRNK